MDTTAKWKGNDGVWNEFDMGTVIGYSRDHLLALFGNRIPVCAKEGEFVITNDAKLHATYVRQRKKVKLFSECKPSEQLFHHVGFLL